MTETIRESQVDPALAGSLADSPRTGSRVLVWWSSVAGFGAVAALCAWLGYYTTFNAFGPWDDEGYLLMSVKAFSHHGGLYTHVYSAFGPLFYEVFATVFSWLPVTHDNGRVVTLIVLILATTGFGAAITIFTRNVFAGLATQLGTFVLLILSFVFESMHPMILVCLLFAVALIALALIARGQRSIGCTVLGASVVGLVLTEVNVGVFAMIAVLFTALTMAPTQWRGLRVAGALLFIGTPFLLIVVAGGHATEHWVVKYALIVAMAAAGVVAVTRDRRDQGLVEKRDVYRFLLGGGTLGVIVVVIAFLTGTGPVDLVRGILIDPARFSSGFTIPLGTPTWVVAWGGASVIGSVLYGRYRSRRPNAGLIDAYMHVGIGLLILYCALQEARLAFSISFTIGLPLLFFAAVPSSDATESQRMARVAVVALAVLEGTVAYPVAGAQVRWSALFLVPAGMLCVHDGILRLHPASDARRSRGWRSAPMVLAAIVLLAGCVWFARVTFDVLRSESTAYYAGTALALPGSNLVRVPATQAATLESVSHAIRAQCSTFLIVPALDSFYFWTGEEPPTDWLNVWFYTLDGPLQKRIVHNIETQSRPRVCVLDNPEWSSFWAQGHVLPQLPLARWVEDFRRENGPPTEIGGYRLFVSHHAQTS